MSLAHLTGLHVDGCEEYRASIRILHMTINQLKNWCDNYELLDKQRRGKAAKVDTSEMDRVICMSPIYQRLYNYKLEDEILLMQSCIVGIPIQPITLSECYYEDTGILMYRILDGMHRGRAITRYRNNEFPLLSKFLSIKGFKEKYGNKRFSDLDEKTQREIKRISVPTTVISISEEHRDKVERHIFCAYNRKNNPISPLHYYLVKKEQFQDWIAAYCSKIRENINNPFETWIIKALHMDAFLDEDKLKTEKVHRRVRTMEYVGDMLMMAYIFQFGLQASKRRAFDYLDLWFEEYDKDAMLATKKLDLSLRKIFKYVSQVYPGVERPFNSNSLGIKTSRPSHIVTSNVMCLADIIKYIDDENVLSGKKTYPDKLKEVITNGFSSTELMSNTYSSCHSKKLIGYCDEVKVKIRSNIV